VETTQAGAPIARQGWLRIKSASDAKSTVRRLQRSIGPLLIILVIAAVLRLNALDLIDVRFDEASAPQFALSIVNGAWLAVAPFSGSVANHPPVFLYVLAIPYLFTRDLLVVAAFRALLDVGAILLLWALCERHFGRVVSILACLFFAVSPWAVQLSRKLSIEEISLFTVMLLFGLLELVRRKNAWGWVMSGWGLALSVGTHLTALYLAPVVIVAWIMAHKTRQAGKMLLGALPLVILAAVYLQYDAAHDFNNLKSFFTASQGTAQVTLDALQFAAWISGGMHLSDLTAGAYPIWQSQFGASLDWIDVLQVALLGSGVAWVLYRFVRSLRCRKWVAAQTQAVLFLWALMPVLLQLRHNRPIQIHYVTPLYPIQFILMALAANAIIAWYQANTRDVKRIAFTALAGAGIVVILVWQVITTFRFMDFVAQYDTSAGGYGLPVRAADSVARLAQDALCQDVSYCEIRNSPSDVIVVAPGGDPLVNEQATILHVLLAGAPHRFANSDAGIIIPPSTAQYIFAPGTEKALQALLVNIEGGSIVSRSFPVRAGYPLAYTYVKTSEPLARHYQSAPYARWANGVELVGYRAEAGAPLKLDVLLRVTAPQTGGADYHWFNHILINGEKAAQLDGGGISAVNWRPGDILVHWFDIPLPSPAPTTPYEVRIGCYKYPSIEGVPVTLNDGTSADGVNLSVQ